MADDTSSANAVAVRTPHYAAVGMNAFGSGALPALNNLADVVSIAQLMAKAGIAVRAHLRENPGACLAVTMQALRWNADPFAIANKTFSVNDQLAYESQVIAAVINTMAPIVGRPEYTYEGEGADRTVTVKVTTTGGQELSLTTPRFSSIHPKNSPLWKSDPDQQQGYYAIRALGRRHFPEIILGIYDPDEMERQERPHTDQPAITSGFGDDKPVRSPRKPREPKPATDTGETSEAAPASPDAGIQANGGEGEVQDAEFEDAKPEATEQPRPQDDAPADVSEEALSGSEATQSASASESSEDPAPPAGTATIASRTETHAPSGELYCLNNDHAGEDGRIPTYKDGITFSRVKPEAKSCPPFYDLHPVEDEDEGGQAGQATGQPTTGETGQSGHDRTDTGHEVHPFIEAIGKVRESPNFLAGKQVLRNLAGTDTWKAADEPARAQVRQALWETYANLRDEGVETIAPYEDFMLARLFLEFGATSAAEIDSMWPRFWKGVYKQANEGDQRAINNLMVARKAELP